MSSPFDPENPTENRQLLLDLVDDEEEEWESAEIVDLSTGESLFAMRKEGDPAVFRLFLFLSRRYGGGTDRFEMTEAIRDAARDYFGARLWNDGSGRKIQAFRHPGDREIVLM